MRARRVGIEAGITIRNTVIFSLWGILLTWLIGCGTFEVDLEPTLAAILPEVTASIAESDVSADGPQPIVEPTATDSPGESEPEVEPVETSELEARAADQAVAEGRVDQGPSPEASPTPFPPPVASTTLSPAPVASATPPILLDALPAPIYYLNVDDSQIWRVEQDAVSLTQITFEGSPVIDFDVSPKDGSLVYISGDELIYYATMLGGRRQVLMQSGEVFEQNKGLTEINSAVRRPRWSPDGSLIAYARGGIHLHRDPAANPQEGVPESRLVRANDPLPDPVPDEDDVFEFEGPQSWYWPLSWLPDGQRILVRISSYGALGSGMAILNIEDGSLSEMKLADDVPCCFNFMTWGNESGRLLQAGRLPVIGSTGLWRSDPLTGESTTLIPDKAGGQFHLFAFPLELGDRVYGFYASASSAAAQPLPLRPMVMVSVAANGSAEFEQLRDDYWVVGQADWLPDGSGAVISDVAGNPGFGPYDGILRWLSSDGGPAVKLPAAGQQPQWGYMPNS